MYDLNYILTLTRKSIEDALKNKPKGKKYLCFGRTSVTHNKNLTKSFLSYTGFLSFIIENLEKNFDAEIDRVLAEISKDGIILQNVSCGIAFFTEEELKERRYTGLRKQDIVGMVCCVFESDSNRELQTSFWHMLFSMSANIGTPLIIYSGGRSEHCLFFFNRLISIEEFEKLQDVASKIKFFHDHSAYATELAKTKKEFLEKYQKNINKIKKDFLSSDISEEKINRMKQLNINCDGQGLIYLRNIDLKKARIDYKEKLNTELSHINSRYNHDIFTLDRLSATAKFRVPQVSRYSKKLEQNNNNRIEVYDSGKKTGVMTFNDEKVELIDIYDLINAFTLFKELTEPYHDVDPETKETITKVSSYKKTDNSTFNSLYNEVQRDYFESIQFDILSHFNATRMEINPRRGRYSVSPDDLGKIGAAPKRAVLRCHSDSGVLTLFSFKTSSQFNVGGKPLNLTMQYIKDQNINLKKEVLERIKEREKITENVGIKKAKKYTAEMWRNLLYEDRVTISSGDKYFDYNLLLDFLKDEEKKIYMLQGKTGLGKTTAQFHIAKDKKICNVVILPYNSIKEGKYLSYYNDQTEGKKKLKDELIKIGITDKEKINNVVTAYGDGRVQFYCPEGYKTRCDLGSIIAENEARGIKTLVTIDEAHSILDKTKFRNTYAFLLNELTYYLKRHNSLKILLLSATIDRYTKDLFATKANLNSSEIDWVNFKPNSEKPVKTKILYVAHNNEVKEIIAIIKDFYENNKDTQNKLVIGFSNVKAIEAVKEAFDNWNAIQGSVGISLVHSDLIKAKKSSNQSNRNKRLSDKLNQKYSIELAEELLEVILREHHLNEEKENSGQHEYHETYLYYSQSKKFMEFLEKNKFFGEKDTDFKGVTKKNFYQLLLYLKTNFVTVYRGTHIDKLLDEGKLTSMFTFVTSCCFEGIDIIDETVKKVIIIANDNTYDMHQWQQFIGRFRLASTLNDDILIILPNSKTRRRVMEPYSRHNLINQMLSADGKLTLTNNIADKLLPDMVINNKISATIAISEVLKSSNRDYLKNHDIITGFLDAHGMEVTSIKVKGVDDYKYDDDVKDTYNLHRKIGRLTQISQDKAYNNNIIEWFSNRPQNIKESLHALFKNKYGTFNINGEFNKNGSLYQLLRLKDLPRNIVEYVSVLNFLDTRFVFEDYVYLMHFMTALTGSQRQELKEFFLEMRDEYIDECKEIKQIKINNKVNGGKEKVKPAFKVNQEYEDQFLKKIEDILIKVNTNLYRILSIDYNHTTARNIFDLLFKLKFGADDGGDANIICTIDFNKAYSTEDVAIKHILEELKEKDTDTLVTRCDRIFKNKVDVRNHFKETLNNYDIAVFTELVRRHSKNINKDYKDYITNDFDANTVTERVLGISSNNPSIYTDCAFNFHDRIVINFIDTLTLAHSKLYGGKKIREMYIPYSIKKLKNIVEQVKLCSPPSIL